MLKLDLIFLFALSLFIDADWSKIISCILGFFAGMCLFLGVEIKSNTLTLKSLLVRTLLAFGVSFIIVTLKDMLYPNWNTAIVVALCTFFSESIITIGSVGFMKYIRKIAGVQYDEPNKNIDG